jgi:hypothetical protein
MKENKKQFYFSDKPIDMADITPLETEYPKKTLSPEPKKITMSFDCVMSEETANWFKKQMEELQEKENEILEKYAQIAKENAEYYIKVMEYTPNGEERKKLLESVIMHSLCKGWNDCFDYNVKRENQQTTL